ncbi:MAG: 50S ribosomal protein L15e [Candidatus Micrarchaeia archaeon]
MGMYKYVQKTFQQQYKERAPEYRARLSVWRNQPVITRIEKPTNIARARSLGFKAKKEFVVARVRVKKGKRVRKKADQGRKPGRNRKRENPSKSWQWFAEQKVARRYPNLDVVGSYYVGEDGQNTFYEVVLKNNCSSKPARSQAKPAAPAATAAGEAVTAKK